MKQIKAPFPTKQWMIVFMLVDGLIMLLYFGSRNISFSQSHFVVSPAVYSNDFNSSKLYKMKPRSIFTLCEMLRDKNWEIREQAAYALGKEKDYRAIEPLIAALKDKDPGVRWTAAWSLGEIRSNKAFEPLLSACIDPDNETNPDIDTWVMRERFLQKKASARRSGNTYEGSVFSGVDIQREAVKSLIKIDRKEAKKRLTPLIEKGKRAGVMAAMEMNDCSLLGDLFDLLEVLDSETPEYWRMIRDIETALQRMACPGIIQRYLFGKLFEQEERVLKQVVKGMDPDTILAAALPALQNQNSRVRKRVLELLYSIWNVKARMEVVRLLDDKDPEIRDSALRILGVHNDSSLKIFYIKKLKDRNQAVRETAAVSLLRMGDLRAIGLLMASESSCHNAECLVQWLGDLANEEARQILLGFLRNRNTMDAPTCTRAYHAALKLGELNEKRAIPYLTKMLRNGNGKEKDAARIALIKMGDIRFMREVLSDLASTVCLKSVQHYMQTKYLDALQEMATPRAAMSLAKLFQSGPHWQDWGWGIDILNTFEKCFAKPLIPLLQEQLKNPIYSIRIKAAEILAHANESAANTALMAALANKDPQINKIALDSLGAKNLIPAQQLIQLIRGEQNWLIASSALAILKRHPVSPADLQALAQIKDRDYLIRHQLKRLIKDSYSAKEESDSLFTPNFPSIMILGEKVIRQLVYSSMGNNYQIGRSGKLAGYSQTLRTNNFLFVSNNHLITRLDHEFRPEKTMQLTRIGAGIADRELLYISSDGQLIILNEELTELGRVPLGIYGDSGKMKNAHAIVVQENIAYLLDNISHPVFILKIDVSDPSQPKRIQETEIEFVNHHLDAQWIAPKQNDWRIIQSSISMGGACQWLLKFSLISGKLKDRILLFRDPENADSWSRIDGWIEAVDPQSPEWMVIRKDSEYFLGRLSMETGELLKQGLLPLGMHSDLKQGSEGQWQIKSEGNIIYIIRDFQLWVIRSGEKPEILVYQEFNQKIMDMVFPDSHHDKAK